jgi:hypothetical protein
VEARAARSGGLLVHGVRERRFEFAQGGVQQGLGAQVAVGVIPVLQFEVLAQVALAVVEAVVLVVGDLGAGLRALALALLAA